MTFLLADRVQETGTANTTVSFTLSGAVAGYQTFAAIGNGNTTFYGATDGTNWEVGVGTYSTTGPTLTRTTITSSSNSGSAVTFSGTVTVWCDYSASGAITNNHGHFDVPFEGSYTDGVTIDYADPVGRISVGGADSIAFYNGGVAGSLLGTIANNGDWSIARFLDIGPGTLIGGATNPVFASAASANNYIQAYIHNDQNGVSSSADFVAYPNNGADTSGWVDMGITSLTYADTTYTCTGPNEGYLFMSAPSGSSTTGNLVYATDSTGTNNYHKWYVGGFTQTSTAWKMQLKDTALDLAIPLNSTVATGTAPFTVASTTQVANLNAATAGTATTATNATNVANTGAVSTNASFYPTFVAANTTSNQGVNTTGSFSINPSTNLVTAQALTLSGGSTSQPPLDFATGTLMTTAQAGAMEFDGAVPYFSIAASTRGAVPTEQIIILTSTNTLTSQTGVQPIFDGGGGPTNGQVTLPVGTYQFECQYGLTGMSATSGSFGFALGGTATKTQTWEAIAAKVANLATSASGTLSYNTAANTALVAANTSTTGFAQIKGIIRVTVTGTVIPQVSLGVAAAAVIQTNSYFKISPMGSSTMVSVGNWS